MATNQSKGREYVRYFCSVCADQGRTTRVLPYDSFEAMTEAPEAGAKGNPILLYSYNSKLNKNERVAWCFTCNEWRPANREGRPEIMLRYLRRRGVTFHYVAKDERGMVRALNHKMEQRRGGSGTISARAR